MDIWSRGMKIENYYKVFCPLLMVVIPVFAISFIPYGLISFITAFILSGFPLVSTVIFFWCYVYDVCSEYFGALYYF